MKQENDVSQCGWLSPSGENLRASYIVFVFVETEKHILFLKQNSL